MSTYYRPSPSSTLFGCEIERETRRRALAKQARDFAKYGKFRSVIGQKAIRALLNDISEFLDHEQDAMDFMWR